MRFRIAHRFMTGGEWAAWKTAHWIAIELQKSFVRKPTGLRKQALNDMLEQMSQDCAEVLGRPENFHILGCRIDEALLALANERDLLPMEAAVLPLTYLHALCIHLDERFAGLSTATKAIEKVSRLRLRKLDVQFEAASRNAALSLGHRPSEAMAKRYSR